MPIAPIDPDRFPGFDFSVGGIDFVWDLDTLLDRVNPFDGGEGLGDAVGAAGDIAGAARDGAIQSVVAAIEPWVGRVAMIILALVFIAGGIALLSSGRPLQLVKEATA